MDLLERLDALCRCVIGRNNPLKIIAIITGLSILIYLFVFNERNITVDLQIANPSLGRGYFYFNKGRGFNSKDKVGFSYKTKNIHVVLDTPYIKSLRYDPFGSDGTITIEQVRINGQRLSNAQLSLKPLKSIAKIEKHGEFGFTVVASGSDPYLILFEGSIEKTNWNRNNLIVFGLIIFAILLAFANQRIRLFGPTSGSRKLKLFYSLGLTLFTVLLISAYLLYLSSGSDSIPFISRILFFEPLLSEYLITLLAILIFVNRYLLPTIFASLIALSYIVINIVQFNSFAIGGDYITRLALDNAESANLLVTFENVLIVTASITVTIACLGFVHLVVRNYRVNSWLTPTMVFASAVLLISTIFLPILFKYRLFSSETLKFTNTLYRINYFKQIGPIDGFVEEILSNDKAKKSIHFSEKEVKQLAGLGLRYIAKQRYPLVKEKIYNHNLELARTIENPNVILILTEGMSARTSTVYSDKYSNLTPNIDEFSRHPNSMIVDNYFNHTAATYRGIAGTLCSIFPKFGGKGGWHDKAADLPRVTYKCLPHMLRNNGYEAIYLNMLYEDSSGLDEMVSNFGFNTIVSGEQLATDYLGGINKLLNSRFTDHQSYRALIGYMKNIDFENPFFISLYTSETHAYLDVGEDGVKYKNGKSNSLNTIHNMDHAFGEFWRYFQNSKYADNTIVIFTADHAHYYEKSFVNTMKALKEDDYKKYFVDKIPLIIFDPTLKKLPHKHMDVRGASSINLAPSLMQYLNLPNENNHFIGRSFFEEGYSAGVANYGKHTFIVHENIVYGRGAIPDKQKKKFMLVDKYIRWSKQLEQANRLYDRKKINAISTVTLR
jgi:phosphoglycerol transferase MdoB-like AlkP superfamily enzyme